MSEKTFYDKDGKVIKRVFTIPIGSFSREEAEKNIKELMNYYKEDIGFPDDIDYKFPENMTIDKDIWFPIKDTTNDNPDYFTDEDNWLEMTRNEKIERLLSKEEQDEIFKKTGFVDWNQYDLDHFANYLEDKWKFSSSGEALAIFKLIEFYRTHK
jgi:hypothetical protein